MSVVLCTDEPINCCREILAAAETMHGPSSRIASEFTWSFIIRTSPYRILQILVDNVLQHNRILRGYPSNHYYPLKFISDSACKTMQMRWIFSLWTLFQGKSCKPTCTCFDYLLPINFKSPGPWKDKHFQQTSVLSQENGNLKQISLIHAHHALAFR